MTKKLILDSTKIEYYQDRIVEWRKGERVAPITVDMSLTRACNYRCTYCYGKLQENTSGSKGHIKWEYLRSFLDDCKEIGVRGVSLVSDGESTCHPMYTDFIIYAHRLGLDVALGTHGSNFTEPELRIVIPRLTYLRFNISAGLPYDYSRIHGVAPRKFYRACANILRAVELRDITRSKCTIGMQMVLTPDDKDLILPLATLALDLGVDYLVIKHCSDDESGALGIDYSRYAKLHDLLHYAEKMSNETTSIVVKWSKIQEGNARTYSRCYGPPFIIQLSGTGLVAPCGMLFNDKYSRYHIGNITETRFKDIVFSDRYWEVMKELASPAFDAKSMCGCLCLQHETNKYLDAILTGKRQLGDVSKRDIPQHIAFI